jgi:Xaa-Pro aminopeptidase
MDHASRVSRLQGELARPLLVTSLANIRYLTGFTGSLAFVIAGPQSFVFITDGRYGERAAELVAAIPGADLIVHSSGLNAAVAQAFSGAGVVDVEAAHISWDAMRSLADATTATLEPSVGIVEQLRRVKSDDEIAAVRRACAAGDAAFDDLEEIARASATEGELGWGLIDAMRAAGGTAAGWPPIVAIGAHASVPHHRSGTGAITDGLLLLDYGCEVDGYHSDMSRTVWRGGGADDEMEHVYEAVKESQQVGVDAVAAGVVAGDIDAACRSVLDRYGYLDYFLHSTGHGVGLEIHEAPWIRSGSEDVLEPGHIITIEPGVYLPGHGGVRIEDTVAVTDAGCDNLTLSHKEFHLA